jgi:hypothetical protein
MRGMTLRELVGSALAKDLSAGPPPEAERHRVQFPLFSSVRPGSLELTNFRQFDGLDVEILGW